MNRLPWKPENCGPLAGAWVPPEFMVAKGLLAGVWAPPEEKLKELVPPPDPKENGDPPFIPG